jgi:hypothetical protein
LVREQTDYDFNKDLFDFTTRLNDGHTRYFTNCYDTYQNILPAPLVSLSPSATDLDKAAIFVAPDATEFLLQLGPEFTQHLAAIPFNFTRLAGARVLAIGNEDPYSFVDKIASTVSGNFLDHNVRVNSVFSSYRIAENAFGQRLGDAAARRLLGDDSLTMTLILTGASEPETIDIPFVARFAGNPFTDKAS